MTIVLIAAFILLVGAGLALLPVGNRLRAGFGLGTQAIATALVLEAALPIAFGDGAVSGELSWAHPVGLVAMRLDALGAFFLVWSLPMTLVGSVYAVGYLRSSFTQDRNVGVHFAFLNLTSLAFVMIYTNQHALIFLLGWEIAALAAWQLVIWEYQSQKVRFAGFNYLVSTHLGLLILVAAFMILYTHSGRWDFDAFQGWLRANPGAERNVVFLLLVVSFGLKAAFFPFHSWLPRAHAAAPAHVSALMSGVIHKAGLYALARFVFLIGQPDEWMGWFLIAFSAVSALVGALYTATQRDLKRLLGYSSTENVGIAGIGFGLGCLGLAWDHAGLIAIGFASGFLHVLNHAFFKCLLFYAAGAVYQATHTVDMERLGGLARAMPWTAGFFLLGGVAIAALPPLNGFASELLLYRGLISGWSLPEGAGFVLALVAALLAFVGAVSALSVTRAFGIAFLGRRRDPALHPPRDPGRAMQAPMVVHAAGCVVLGLSPMIGLALVREASALAVGGRAGAGAIDDLMGPLGRLGLWSGALVLVTAALFGARHLLLRRAPTARHVTWGCGYAGASPRMQYSGASFTAQFAHLFRGFAAVLRREVLPRGPFPTEGHVGTHHRDAVEHRLYEVLGRGDRTAGRLATLLGTEHPRSAFALGLLALVLITGLVLISGGAP
jgi:hydrogenase-4 component B